MGEIEEEFVIVGLMDKFVGMFEVWKGGNN
jgi:hypothetical protein